MSTTTTTTTTSSTTSATDMNKNEEMTLSHLLFVLRNFPEQNSFTPRYVV
jgi:hypothetical protein